MKPQKEKEEMTTMRPAFVVAAFVVCLAATAAADHYVQFWVPSDFETAWPVVTSSLTGNPIARVNPETDHVVIVSDHVLVCAFDEPPLPPFPPPMDFGGAHVSMLRDFLDRDVTVPPPSTYRCLTFEELRHYIREH